MLGTTNPVKGDAMMSIVDRLLGRQPGPGEAHEGCCGGHGKHGQHAAHAGAQHGSGGCCGGHEHDHHADEAAGEAHDTPIAPAGRRS